MPHSYLKDFEAFWRVFPNRVGKLAAEKAYGKARQRATAEELIAGVQRYMANKPAYADWCHPSTWLNQGRWMDEAPVRSRGSLCPHDPQCATRTACINRALDEGRAARAKAAS